MARFYITTSIMYANASPHVGFALELVQADAVARYRRLMGDEVRFLTGTDEHGTKVMRTAQDAGVQPQEFVDRIAGKVAELAQRFGVSNDDFIRTSDRARHWPAVQKLWQMLAERGDLYKKSYEGYYCIGHEAFIKSSELIDGLCPLHRSKPELVKEENWFFRLTKYASQVRELLATDRIRIVPASRKSEVLNMLDDVEDVSFSRPSEQLPWGIPVPDDPTQTMYVWADALTNYVSALGYGTDEANMAFWPADVHLIGKDILRFHAMIWPAMLLSAGLETPKNIYVHGFITVDGQKMSKTIGNIVDPFQLLDQWPAEVIRYFLLRELQSTDDGDFSWKNLENRYTTDLANGLGNLVQRVFTLIKTKLAGKIVLEPNLGSTEPVLQSIYDDSGYSEAFRLFRLHDAAANVWAKIGELNAYLNDQAPWKQGEDAQRQTLTVAAVAIHHIAWLLSPFMPETARRISDMLGASPTAALPAERKLTVEIGGPLFPRREVEE